MKTRITELLGIEHPIFQAAMSWASSNSQLVMAVSIAGGLGVIERLAGLGYEAVGSTPQELASFNKSEVEVWRRAVTAAKVEAE